MKIVSLFGTKIVQWPQDHNICRKIQHIWGNGTISPTKFGKFWRSFCETGQFQSLSTFFSMRQQEEKRKLERWDHFSAWKKGPRTKSNRTLPFSRLWKEGPDRFPVFVLEFPPRGLFGVQKQFFSDFYLDSSWHLGPVTSSRSMRADLSHFELNVGVKEGMEWREDKLDVFVRNERKKRRKKDLTGWAR